MNGVITTKEVTADGMTQIVADSTAGHKDTAQFHSALLELDVIKSFYYRKITPEQASKLDELPLEYFVADKNLKSMTVGEVVHDIMTALYIYLKPELPGAVDLWIPVGQYDARRESRIRIALTVLQNLGVDEAKLRALMSTGLHGISNQHPGAHLAPPPESVQNFLAAELRKIQSP